MEREREQIGRPVIVFYYYYIKILKKKPSTIVYVRQDKYEIALVNGGVQLCICQSSTR